MADLALDDLARARDAVRFLRVNAHQLQSRGDRRERVSQLVPEHREELVLPPIHLGELLDRRTERGFERRALAHLVLEGLGLLLERDDDPTLFVGLHCGVALGRDHRAVRERDLGECLRVSRIVER